MDKKTKAERRYVWRAVFAGAGAAAGMLLLVLLEASLCAAGRLSQGREALWARLALLLASAAAGLVSAGGVKTGKLTYAAMTAGVLSLFVIILGLLCESSTLINISLLWNLLAVLCGVFAGSMLTARRRRRRRR